MVRLSQWQQKTDAIVSRKVLELQVFMTQRDALHG
jgi:hypothetical protein